MPLYGFIGETSSRLAGVGTRKVTFREPPLLVEGARAVWLAPQPGLDVWVGLVRCDTQAAADALTAAATAAGLRLRLFPFTDDDGATARPIGAVARTLLNAVLTARGMADITLTASDDERTVFDRIAKRISGGPQGRAELRARATAAGLRA